MERHRAVFVFCLQSWLFLSISTTSAPELVEMKVPAESPSEIAGKLPEKRLSPPDTARAELKINADDLMSVNDETEDESDDADMLGDTQETIRDPEKFKRSFPEEKPRSRLVERRHLGDGKNLAEPETRDHSLQKREAVSTDNGDFYDVFYWLKVVGNNLNAFRERHEALLKHRLKYHETVHELSEHENTTVAPMQEKEKLVSVEDLWVASNETAQEFRLGLGDDDD